MGRKKQDEDAINQKVAIQSAFFKALSLTGVEQYKIELNLGIGNSSQDGSVWRKIGRGVQLLKMESLIEKVLLAERLGWCNSAEILSAAADVNRMRDQNIIEEHIKEWTERVSDMTLLCSFGTTTTKNQMINVFEAAIERLKGGK